MESRYKASRDYIGKRGEAIATARLMDFCGRPYPYFDPHFLGEKCPTYDFLVELVDARASPLYFFAQVKATHQRIGPGTARLKVAIRPQDVRRMVQSPIPAYLIAVDEWTENAFIVSIHGDLDRRISSVPTAYPLNPSNLGILWEEVAAYWERLEASAIARTSLFCF